MTHPTSLRFLTASLFVLLLVINSPLSAQISRPSSAGMPTDLPAANFNVREVGMLNEASRQMRSGRPENAVLTYDAILGMRPNWLPALVGKAETLRRLGRTAEADRYQKSALRQDNLATGFLLSRGRNALLRYLALYPEEVLPVRKMTDEEAAAFSKEDYFDQQLMTIAQLPDSVSLNNVLKAKVSGDRIRSSRKLHTLMYDQVIGADLGFMLEGNLDMLNHDYLGAVAAYNQAVDFRAEPWPEVTYNRGLAFILLDNYTNGCAELQRSMQQGFKPAEQMLKSLCNF